jgi:hypothetical protein
LGKASQKSISDLINECYHQQSEKKVISSLEELLEKTKSGMVSYENYKNMARAAINNIIIEDLIAEKNKQKTK